jgi:7,8-dihydropterin-6-yl-methyl-4-(beta-D-ribofuranosyl)aminobenzene 5'-phosphate synthase
VAEHGLSFCIQGNGWQTVFDTGQSGAFAENAGKLGIDLSQTTELVLSHGHYDHTGGLPAFFDAVPNATVYAHPDATLERYSIKDPNVPKRVGIPTESLHRLKQHGFKAVEHLTQVNETQRLSGPVPRNTDYEDVGGPFFWMLKVPGLM